MRVPVRHSLVTRLLVTSVLIAIAATTATAWLATTTATRAINQERGRSLTDDKGVYDMLVEYAATHEDWSAAASLIHERAAALDRRITLTTPDRRLIAESGGGPALDAARPSATVDPLDLDLTLTGGTDRIDPRVVGPYGFTTAERKELRVVAREQRDCVLKQGLDARIEQEPGGRPRVVVSGPDQQAVDRVSLGCQSKLTGYVSASGRRALAELSLAVGTCLKLDDPEQLHVTAAGTMFVAPTDGREPVAVAEEALLTIDSEGKAARNCLDRERRAQLQPYVAPPALLFVTDPRTGADRTTFTLSRDNIVRIVTVTGAVLLATILITVLVGRRLVRPLRALTDAADRQTPVAVTARDEIGHLARALRDSAQRRDRAEAQRRAMVSDVAHELRTPLTNIRSWLEAAQDDLAPTDAQLLNLLHEEAMLLQHVIDDLGDLAAADAGTLRVHREPLRVRETLAHVVDSHRGTAQSSGVTLVTDVVGEPVVDADPVRLRQIVGNLVSNAIRHTPAGGTVTVGAHGATVTVADTGVGISEENLPKVFDRFWRADESRSRSTGGSGLGLSIVRKLVEAHGGTVTVASTPGAGTVFTVVLRVPEKD
ncbi:sensor histidine kinase [Actinoplanes rectilineatus]|uniref:sensor histidine kinase n=1 Tax=Actinoplanes rectilineatus TaxID=113571 RepID=UPI0005F2945F|nr:HAMP domain-containing sensor histidine kinase [Actinoplanes rectilineatus]